MRSVSIIASLTALALLAGAGAAAFAREAPPSPRKAVKLAGMKSSVGRGQPRALRPARSMTEANRPSPPTISRQDFAKARAEHKSAILAQRARLPHRPLPGEHGFTGVRPPGETRFVAHAAAWATVVGADARE